MPLVKTFFVIWELGGKEYLIAVPFKEDGTVYSKSECLQFIKEWVHPQVHPNPFSEDQITLKIPKKKKK